MDRDAQTGTAFGRLNLAAAFKIFAAVRLLAI
jgi:hypothetical protein